MIALDSAAIEEEIYTFARSLRPRISSSIGWDAAEDILHDAALAAIEAVRSSGIESNVEGWIRTVIRRKVSEALAQSHRELALLEGGGAYRSASLEQMALSREEMRQAREVLRTLPYEDRELLRRFYLEDESEAEICRDMGLSATQFRIRKWRAKAKVSPIRD
jgi:RNA polymerase sigma factor (sigma-70 family)